MILDIFVLLHEVHQRLVWVDITLQNCIKSLTAMCGLQKREEAVLKVAGNPTLAILI
jgi:hypothetical protein